MPLSAPAFDAGAVRDYYDRHTPAFLAWGQGGGLGAIRRAVRAPGVVTDADAFHYVDDCIGAALDTLAPAHGPLRVVDLGCGVGASLCYLAARRPLDATGLTLSPAQATEAIRRVAAEGLSDRVRVLVADFCTPPAGLIADAAWAIEAFAHAPSAGRFFAAAARLVRPGGLLLICDDFATPDGGRAAEAARARDRRGWRLNTLLPVDDARAAASAADFALEADASLTTWLDLARPRDHVLAVAAGVLARMPGAWRRYGPLLGGNALRRGLRRGWIDYRLLRFRRSG
jgi:SAM-dependent methyltransferase